MRHWFTADLHLGHANILKYCQRPFLSQAEQERLRDQGPRGNWTVSQATLSHHDTALLNAINEHVREDDRLWVLGDFCSGGLAEAAAYRHRIVCQNVSLAWGNHDDRSIASLFAEAIEQGMIEVEGQPIWLNHYPMRSWHGSARGAWHLYGHVHGRLGRQDREEFDWMLTRDVGVDACQYSPISFEALARYMAPRQKKFEARRKAAAGSDDVV
jgi:calcineurin-like phosphoesterase family protein